MVLSKNLKKENILVKTKSTTRWNLINELLEVALKNNEFKPEDKEYIEKSLIEREKSMSTGIGNGVAIPHCTTTKVRDIVIIMAISKKGIDFDAIDSLPVKIIILLLVPKNKLTQHIKTLANIAKLMNHETLRNKLLELKNPDEIISELQKTEKAK